MGEHDRPDAVNSIDAIQGKTFIRTQELVANPMRVGINVRYLASPMSGIERYIAELMAHASEDSCTFSPRVVSASFANTKQQNPLLAYVRPFYNAAWDRYMDLLEGGMPDIDVFHAPSFIAPKLKRDTPTVITVHDLAFKIYPEFFDYRTKAYLSLFFEKSLIQAKRIICVSSTTASDLLRYYPSHKDKVRVVYNGFKDFSQINPDNSILGDLNVCREQYILCVGAFNARKNIGAVVSIAPMLYEKYPHLKIVIVGRKPVKNPCTEHANVVFTGFIDDEKLSSLYRNASLFVYPSKYEGFGFPVLEAMSVGTPVAYARSSCLPEIAGLGDGYSFDPDRPINIYETIVRLLGSRREGEWRESAHESLARFSWSRMSRETIEVYRECLC